jgi:hypothetical protein
MIWCYSLIVMPHQNGPGYMPPYSYDMDTITKVCYTQLCLGLKWVEKKEYSKIIIDKQKKKSYNQWQVEHVSLKKQWKSLFNGTT